MALAISGYLQHVTFYSHKIQIATWVVCFVFFTVIHIFGGKSSINFQSAIVMLCLGVLVVYFVAATLHFDFQGRSIGERGWFVNGFFGFVSAFPFGIWFMDGFEELPLAVSYAEDPARSVPRAMMISFVMALFLAVSLLVLGSGSTDPEILMDATAPLMVTFTNVWGQNHFLIYALDATIILGLAVSFSSFVLLSGNMIQVMAMEGDMLPVVLSKLHPEYHTPANATVFSSLLGFGITAIFGIMFGEDLAEDALITCSLLASVSCYMFNFSCLYKVYCVEEEELRLKASGGGAPASDPDASICGHDPENLRFVLGKAGTVVGLIMCVFVLLCIIYLFVTVEDYHYGLSIIAGTTIVCLVVTAIYGYIHRHFFGDGGFPHKSSSSTSNDGSQGSDIMADDSTRSTAPLTRRGRGEGV
jgi:amino acid transporter